MSDAASVWSRRWRLSGLGYWLYVYLALFIVGGIVSFPLLAAAIGGFKSLGELRTNPFGLPAQWEWENYWTILTGPDYWRMLGNSLTIGAILCFLAWCSVRWPRSRSLM